MTKAETRIDMYHCTTGKVDSAHLLQPTATPYEVGHGIIDDDRPKNGEQQESWRTSAFGKSTDDERGSDDGEHALKEYKRQSQEYPPEPTPSEWLPMEEHFVESSYNEPRAVP
jgi:hypothetical protein